MKTNILLFKINIYFFSLLLFYSPKSYNQTLTAEQIYKKITNTVVVIHAYDYNNELTKQGSGVVLNDKGYVVTNYHVLADCERLEILHDKEIVPYVDIIGIDVQKDILILKIEAKKFTAIKIGDSKSLKIGQRIYALGSPLGYENTISEGIISGLRSYEESQKNFIQITASISPGSSGGAIVNDKGELIGISTLTAKEEQNINFAIPIDDVLNVEIGSYSEGKLYKDFEWFYKGYNAGEKGDYHQAIKYYSQYIQRFTNDAEAYYNRGYVKVRLEDYRGAIQDFSKAIEINPHNDIAYNNRGLTKYYLGDYRGAIQDYNIAIKINPKDADVYTNRGVVKSAFEDYRGAIQDYNKAIEINPNLAQAYYNRGLNKAILGDTSGACLDWSKAGELGYENAYETIKKYCY